MSETYQEAAWEVIREVEKAVVGKEQVIEKIMTAILAGGHILVEDMRGTGKTTMALAFSRAMGLKEKRVQFTPDVLPSDLTGFTIYKKELEKFVYQPGAAMCNFLLADENRARTQKADAADNLGADASIADGDAGAFIVHIERNGICNHEAFHNGDD